MKAAKLRKLLTLALNDAATTGEKLNAIRAASKIVAELGGIDKAFEAIVRGEPVVCAGPATGKGSTNPNSGFHWEYAGFNDDFESMKEAFFGSVFGRKAKRYADRKRDEAIKEEREKIKKQQAEKEERRRWENVQRKLAEKQERDKKAFEEEIPSMRTFYFNQAIKEGLMRDEAAKKADKRIKDDWEEKFGREETEI